MRRREVSLSGEAEMEIKEKIKQKLHARALKRFEQELEFAQCAYEGRLTPKERKRDALSLLGKTQGRYRFLSFHEYLTAKSAGNADFLMFLNGNGVVDKTVLPKIEAYMDKEPECFWLYTDEDVMFPNGRMGWPWYKPEWSPDTLLSFRYTGNLLVVRASLIPEIAGDGVSFEEMFWALVRKCPAHHLEQIAYHYLDPVTPEEDRMYIRRPDSGAVAESRDKAVREAYLESLKSPARIESDADGYDYPVYALPEQDNRISILIPSKEHPEVLERCVASIRQRSSYKEYEILVIDNGSTSENRSRYEVLSERYGYRYFYRPMEFNFSAMCNMAAAEAEGQYFLFLNDDTEVITTDWLERMLGQAARNETGAVGAKLYYPVQEKEEGIRRIQHIGVTNMKGAPLHKLFGWDDAPVYDRGRNRGVWNVLAVTAACLMVEREKFRAVGGFSEELAVAYNDVDLCYSLKEKGWRNVMRMDVKLTHYESLSRGNDNVDEAKTERLRRERERLYQRHPVYAKYDPYYHKFMTGISERFEPLRPEESGIAGIAGMVPAVKPKRKQIRLTSEQINETLILHVDSMETQEDAGKTYAYLRMHAHVRGLDNSDYLLFLYLKGEDGSVYRIPAKRIYRPDVVKTYYEQTHVELSGFCFRIEKDQLAAGSYEIWVEAKSLVSRQRLFNRTEEAFRIG